MFFSMHVRQRKIKSSALPLEGAIPNNVSTGSTMVTTPCDAGKLALSSQIVPARDVRELLSARAGS